MCRNIYLSFIFLVLIGCAATKPVQPTLEFAPVMPVDNSQMKVADGSIYEASENGLGLEENATTRLEM